MLEDQKIRLSEVIRMFTRAGYTVVPATFKRWVSEGRFPEGIKVTERLVVWDRGDIERAIRALSQATDSTTGAE